MGKQRLSQADVLFNKITFVNPRLDASAAAGIIVAGSSATPIVNDKAGTNFVQLYFDDGATSGDARGIYDRLYITGAGGGGEALRAFTSVQNVVGASAHGAHISLSFGASGKLTGQGVAARATLHMPSTAITAGNVTYAAVEAEIYSDAATSDPGGNLLSCFLVGNNGDGTGAADVDDDCALFDFRGWTIGDANMIATKAAGQAAPNVKWSVRCRLPDGTAAYLMLSDAPLTA